MLCDQGTVDAVVARIRGQKEGRREDKLELRVTRERADSSWDSVNDLDLLASA